MRLPDELLNIVVRFAWMVPLQWTTSDRTLVDQLDCAIDCQRNIPPWFLNDIDFAYLDSSKPIFGFGGKLHALQPRADEAKPPQRLLVVHLH